MSRKRSRPSLKPKHTLKNDKIRSAVVTLATTAILLTLSAIGIVEVTDTSLENVINSSNTIVEEVINIAHELFSDNSEEDYSEDAIDEELADGEEPYSEEYSEENIEESKEN